MPRLASDDWKEWLQYAKSDYKEAISALNRNSFKEACFHAQQSCEKLLKAILIKRGTFIPIHDLSELARETGIEEPILLNKLSRLTIHYYASRYPDAARRTMIKYDLNTAKECVEVMRELWDTLRKYLE
ncbi:MAG: HEPN domain-containing protein [Thermoproteota archaeon]|jgi:HEPN domain-containing protein